MTARARLLSWSVELDRVARVLSIAREELAFRYFTESDWLDLGRLLYGSAPKYSRGSEHNESGLFAFEHSAIEEAFPPPPAAILVGGCGGGRELFALVERGYRIAAAYDPVAPFIAALRSDPRLSESKDRLCIGVHQAIESLAPIADLRRSGKPIDAVVVGWGSYTHIWGTRARVEFLRSLRALCPHGPVLLSFFVGMDNEAVRPHRFRSRLRRILGTTDAMVEEGDGLHRGAGGIHYFTEASFTAEASKAGYCVRQWREHDFAAAHAILVPQSHGESP
jgi:SAM-dependent methyltransferase